MRLHILLLSCLISACAEDNSKEISNAIIGAWEEILPFHICDGCGGYINYRLDGTYIYKGEWPHEDKRWVSEGNWKAQKNMLCIIPQKRQFYKYSSGEKIVNKTFPIEEICNEVISYNESEIVLDTNFEKHSKLIRL